MPPAHDPHAQQQPEEHQNVVVPIDHKGEQQAGVPGPEQGEGGAYGRFLPGQHLPDQPGDGQVQQGGQPFKHQQPQQQVVSTDAGDGGGGRFPHRPIGRGRVGPFTGVGRDGSIGKLAGRGGEGIGVI